MEIQELVNYYNNKIELLEKELKEIRKKKEVLLEAVKDALEMFDKKPISGGSDSPINNITVISDKYSNMTWPDAILLALTDRGELTGEQLLRELFENGFKSDSKSVKSDMYGRLKTLEEKNKVIAIKEGKQFKKYKRKYDEIEEKNGSASHMPKQSRFINGELGE